MKLKKLLITTALITSASMVIVTTTPAMAESGIYDSNNFQTYVNYQHNTNFFTFQNTDPSNYFAYRMPFDSYQAISTGQFGQDNFANVDQEGSSFGHYVTTNLNQLGNNNHAISITTTTGDNVRFPGDNIANLVSIYQDGDLSISDQSPEWGKGNYNISSVYTTGSGNNIGAAENGNSNTLTMTTTGNVNLANVSIGGDSNNSDITVNGNNNTINIATDNFAGWYVGPDGNWHWAPEYTAINNNNSMFVKQTGSFDSALITTGQTEEEASNGILSSAISQYNSVSITQAGGDRNQVSVTLLPGDSQDWVTVSQNGSGNIASVLNGLGSNLETSNISQQGTSNQAFINQDATGQTAAITQSGLGNIDTITQSSAVGTTGVGSAATIADLNGLDDTVTVNNSSRQTANLTLINQTNDNTIATQSGLGNDTEITEGARLSGHSNSVSVNQDSDNASFLTGDSYTKAAIDGSGNRVQINQTSTNFGNSFKLTVLGDSNAVTDVSHGSENFAIMSVQGNSNTTSASQFGTGYTNSSPFYSNINLQQIGNNNNAAATQGSAVADTSVSQANAAQYGNYNAIKILQLGTGGDSATVNQYGDSNSASIIEDGGSNVALITQGTSNSKASNNNASIGVSGNIGNMLTIAQDGNNSTATQAITSPFDTASITQNSTSASTSANNLVSTINDSLGSNNTFNIIQNGGVANSAILTGASTGNANDYNALSVDQENTSMGNIAVAVTNGSNNTFGVSQTGGTNNKATVNISGNSNQSRVFTSTYGTTGIDQYKTNNAVIETDLTGNGNGMTAHQSQVDNSTLTLALSGNNNLVNGEQNKPAFVLRGGPVTILSDTVSAIGLENSLSAPVSIIGTSSKALPLNGSANQVGTTNAKNSIIITPVQVSGGGNGFCGKPECAYPINQTANATNDTLTASVTGDGNTFTGRQYGSNNSLTAAITGQSNTVTAQQNGDGNMLIDTISGNGVADSVRSAVFSPASGGTTFGTATNNNITSTQNGSANTMSVAINGGSYDNVTATQNGNNNAMNLAFSGRNDTGNFTQTGNNLSYSLNTNLSGKTFTVSQHN